MRAIPVTVGAHNLTLADLGHQSDGIHLIHHLRDVSALDRPYMVEVHHVGRIAHTTVGARPRLRGLEDRAVPSGSFASPLRDPLDLRFTVSPVPLAVICGKARATVRMKAGLAAVPPAESRRWKHLFAARAALHVVSHTRMVTRG